MKKDDFSDNEKISSIGNYFEPKKDFSICASNGAKDVYLQELTQKFDQQRYEQVMIWVTLMELLIFR